MVFYSKLGDGEFVIDDDNAHQFFEPPRDQSKGHIDRDRAIEPLGALFAPMPDEFLVPRSEWDARIEEMEATESRLSDMMKLAEVPSLDQNGTNYCWCNAVITAIHAVRARNGQQYRELSPAFAATQIKNFQNVGGWDSQAVKFISQYGVCESKYWPVNAIDRKYLTQEAKQNALLYVLKEWYDIPEHKAFDFKMSCLFRRVPVPSGYQWWSHETCALDPVKIGSGSYGTRERNSWGNQYGQSGYFVLAEPKSRPDNASAPRIMEPT